MSKPKEKTSKRKQSVQCTESTPLDLVDKAMELIEAYKQSDSRCHFKVVEAGLEEEVIGVLLGGWTLVWAATALMLKGGKKKVRAF